VYLLRVYHTGVQIDAGHVTSKVRSSGDFSVWAVRLFASGVDHEVMALGAHVKESSYGFGDQAHLGVAEFFNSAAIHAYQVIVLLPS